VWCGLVWSSVRCGVDMYFNLYFELELVKKQAYSSTDADRKIDLSIDLQSKS
jgi:hypothetical protein